MRFYLYERLQRIRKQLRPKTCWDIRCLLAWYGFLCARFVVHVLDRRYVAWLARYDALTVTSNVLRINFLEEVCMFGLIICGFAIDLFVEQTDPWLTLWAYMHCIHSQHVHNYRANKIGNHKFFDPKFRTLLRSQQLLEPPNRILRWAHNYLPELFDHRCLTLAAYRHQSPFLRLSTFQHRYNNIVVVHVAELIYYIFIKFLYVLIVLFMWIGLCLQLGFFSPMLLPLLVVENYLLAQIVVVVARICITLIIFCYIGCVQLRVYFDLLNRLVARHIQQIKQNAALPQIFRLFQVEYNRSLWLLMKIDQEFYNYTTIALIIVNFPVLVVHANLVYFEPRMNAGVKAYIVILTTLQMTAALRCILMIIPASEAAYAVTNMLPALQLQLPPQSGRTRMKLKVMQHFEVLNCPMSERVTISIGSIDKITRYSMVQLTISLSNLFLMIARLLIEERQNWIYE